jgi:rhamnulokinase
LQIPVIAGPVEATALGNVLIQAIALGALPSLDAARKVVRDSFAVSEFKPAERQLWETKLDEFKKLSAP